MAKPARTENHGTFFITAITHNRRRIFQVDANAQLFLETLQHYRRTGLYKLHAFVVMPDHVHLLLTTNNLTQTMQAIKGGFSHRIASRTPVWQRGFADHLVRDEKEFTSRRDYIHDNPIRAKRCELPEEFPYSSAYKPLPTPS